MHDGVIGALFGDQTSSVPSAHSFISVRPQFFPRYRREMQDERGHYKTEDGSLSIESAENAPFKP